MNFTVATPVFRGLPWLRLCVASVRDQVAAVGCDMQDAEYGTESGQPASTRKNQKREVPSLAVEHIVQDAGSPGIEEFAHEVGAEFYRNGKLISHSPFDSQAHRPDDSGQSVSLRSAPSPSYSLIVSSEPDEGMYDAINRAWQRATGDIISYLNADEQYLPGTLERAGKFFEANPKIDLLFGDALLLNPDGLPIAYRRVVYPSRAHTRAVHLGALSCAMFFRRSLLEKGFFFEPKWKAIGDAEWVWRVLGSGAKAGILNEPLSAFTLTGSNLGATPASLQEASRWRASGSPLERIATPFLRANHWIKKAIAGAYFPQAVTSAVFTARSPDRRVPIQSSALGSQWPKS
jgi:glycosyltransferase involved in cell wall biosynthesis